MNASIGIKDVVYYKPDHVYTIDELSAQGKVDSGEEELKKFGFSNCAISSKSSSDMAIEVSKELLEKNNVNPCDVGLLICAHAISPSGMVPAKGDKCVLDSGISNLGLFKFAAPRLQYELDLHEAKVIGLSDLGCVSLLNAVGLAKDVLPSTNKRYAVCVNADVLPESSSREVLYSVISDAACAVLIDMESDDNHILGHAQLTKGFYWDCEDTNNELLAAYFPTASRFISNFMDSKKITMSDIKKILPNNVSKRSWEILCNLLGIGLDKVYTSNISKTGHSIACDNFINYADMVHDGHIEKGDLLLLFGFGLGAHWSCMLVQV